MISKTVVDKSATRAAKNPIEVEFSETSQTTAAATTLGNSSNFVCTSMDFAFNYIYLAESAAESAVPSLINNTTLGGFNNSKISETSSTARSTESTTFSKTTTSSATTSTTTAYTTTSTTTTSTTTPPSVKICCYLSIDIC